MFKTSALAIMFVVLIAPLSLKAAAQVFKCVNKGSVIYQSVPCPSGVKMDAPTVEKLNADRQKGLSQGGIRPAAPPTVATGIEPSSTSGSSSWSSSPTDKGRPNGAVAPITLPIDSFKCDGRVHCSQMTSCSEAKYFLSRCPGVKMDGDGDGIPCEDQWCSK